LATTHQCFIFLAIRISLTCGRAFIFGFLQKKTLPMPVLRWNSGFTKLGQASIFPVFSANRSSAVQCRSGDLRLISVGLKVRELTFSSPAMSFDEGKKQGLGLIFAHER
jgi:hypothetical protein